jgi:peptide deformylase
MNVRVEYLNENGEKVELNAEGLLARCICHEIDHLDGILFIDRVEEGN